MLIPTRNVRKHPLLMFKGYTYNKYHNIGSNKIYWRCSKIRGGCKAAFRTNSDGTFKQFHILHADHNHDPPRYHCTADDKWIRL